MSGKDRRHCGIGGALLNAIEEARRLELDPVTEQWRVDDVPALIASGRAYSLTKTASAALRAVPTEYDCLQRRSVISDIAKATRWIRLGGDPAPMMPPIPEWTSWPRPDVGLPLTAAHTGVEAPRP
jgi:hypothetical protein